MSIGERVKELRSELKLTQIEFGRRIGTSGATVSTTESGKTTPDNQTLLLISREFGVRREWLEFGDEPKYERDVPQEDADFAAVLRAMTGGSETKKQLLRIVADMPDELLEAVHQYFIATKNTPKA